MAVARARREARPLARAEAEAAERRRRDVAAWRAGKIAARRRVPPELKVMAPAHTKHLGWHVEFESRVTHLRSKNCFEHLMQCPDSGCYVEFESRLAQGGGGGTGADEAHDLSARSRPPLAWVARGVPGFHN